MSLLSEKLAAGEFVVTGEVSPPAGTDYRCMRRSVQILGPRCTAINVTDNQGANLHLSSLAASKVVLDAGYEPIFQQTCRDRNRLALQSDLLAAWTLGLRNVLLVTGDDPLRGDHPQARRVYDLDSTQLILMANRLNEGYAMNGRELDGGTDFYIGAVCFPEAEPWMIQRERAFQKVQAGARFFQTQAVMDIDTFAERCLELRSTGVKVIASVLLLKSKGVVNFLNNNLAGVMVPDHIRDRIAYADEPMEEAIALAIEQIEILKEVADGVHIMPLGADEAVPKILDGVGLL